MRIVVAETPCNVVRLCDTIAGGIIKSLLTQIHRRGAEDIEDTDKQMKQLSHCGVEGVINQLCDCEQGYLFMSSFIISRWWRFFGNDTITIVEVSV